MDSKTESIEKISNELPKLNLNAAGIDIGSDEHFVAVPAGRDEQTVCSFKSFTSDLYVLAKWLKKCKITTVVMESTGVYWISLYQILESEGFEVLLVNSRHAKNVPGRKSDVSDCQWLQQLHTYGLLRGSFQPESIIRELRTYLRQKDSLIKCASSHIQHMQKFLTLMNIKLQNVFSDITGKSGMDIISAIVEGEMNPDNLIMYCDRRLKNSVEVIKKSLVGNYTEENIFGLKQSLELYNYYQEKIIECDEQIHKLLKKFETNEKNTEHNESQDTGKKVKKNKKIDPVIQKEIIRICGVDLTQIDGLNTSSVLTLISEVGLDMSKWKTEKHFTSWLGLAPNNKISGGKILSSNTKKIKSRANRSFRLAAHSTKLSQNML